MMINIEGEVNRIINDMYVQFRQTFPWVGRDMSIQLDAWEHVGEIGRRITFKIWHKSRFIVHDRPIKEWDDFIRKYKILFRDFKTEGPF